MKMSRTQFLALPLREDRRWYRPGYYRSQDVTDAVFELPDFYNQSLSNLQWATTPVQIVEQDVDNG